jgi:hypothetical protein
MSSILDTKVNFLKYFDVIRLAIKKIIIFK